MSRFSHDLDSLVEFLAQAFRDSVDGDEGVPFEVRGGLLHRGDGSNPEDPFGEESTYIDLGTALDEWLPEGWAER